MLAIAGSAVSALRGRWAGAAMARLPPPSPRSDLPNGTCRRRRPAAATTSAGRKRQAAALTNDELRDPRHGPELEILLQVCGVRKRKPRSTIGLASARVAEADAAPCCLANKGDCLPARVTPASMPARAFCHSARTALVVLDAATQEAGRSLNPRAGSDRPIRGGAGPPLPRDRPVCGRSPTGGFGYPKELVRCLGR